MLSAKKLCKQDVAVISHGHRDHWATNLVQMDTILIPQQVTVPNECQTLNNFMRVDYSVRLGKLDIIKLDQRRLTDYLGERLPRVHVPHAFWWLLAPTHRHEDARILFVGDLDIDDIRTLRVVVAEMFRRDTPLHGVLLPSFGGITSHGIGGPKELSTKVRNLAHDLHDMHSIALGGLPHPLNADWADYNAATLPSITE
jgi:hypothetical protein